MVARQVSLGLAVVDTRLNMVKVTDFLDNEQIFWITGSGECEWNCFGWVIILLGKVLYTSWGGEQPLDHKPWGHGVQFEFYLLGGCQILFLNILNQFYNVR